MAKQTMDAIRDAELNAEHILREAQVSAHESVVNAQAEAEQLIAAAQKRAADRLAETRAQAQQDSEASARAASDDVTREIEELRARCRRNEADAIKAVIAEMT